MVTTIKIHSLAISVTGLALILIINSISCVVAEQTGWQYWHNVKALGVSGYDQSQDFIINTPKGNVKIIDIDFYMAVLKVLPGDATFVIAVMYGPFEPWFNPSDLQSSSSMLQGIRVILSPSAKCGMSAGDFAISVRFELSDLKYEPSTWQCITKILHANANTFTTNGNFHLKLAYYLESSSNPNQGLMLIPGKPDPKVNAVFSVTTGESTTVIDPTVYKTVVTTATSPNEATDVVNPPVSGSVNMLPYAAAGGGALAIALSVMFFMSRHREKGTEIFTTRSKYPGEKGTRVYGQPDAATSGTVIRERRKGTKGET